MADLKVAQLRASLEEFASLYRQAGASDEAQALQMLAQAMHKADKLAVDELLAALEKATLRSATDRR